MCMRYRQGDMLFVHATLRRALVVASVNTYMFTVYVRTDEKDKPTEQITFSTDSVYMFYQG